MKFINYINLIFIYFNTIKYLKLSQIYYRFKKNYLKKFIKINTQVANLEVSNFEILSKIFPTKNIQINEHYLILLNQKIYFYKNNWNNRSYSKLLIYNLNYFDFLHCNFSYDNFIFSHNIINDWIQSCKNHLSDPWDPYPTSRRIINWIKWLKT